MILGCPMFYRSEAKSRKVMKLTICSPALLPLGTALQRQVYEVLSVANSTPWMFGLNRSLGGGASVHFEHSDPDIAGKKSTSWLALSVSF